MFFWKLRWEVKGWKKFGLKIRIWKSLTILGWKFLNERNALN